MMLSCAVAYGQQTSSPARTPPASAPASMPANVRRSSAACDATYQQAVKADSRVVTGDDGWLFWPPEMRHLDRRALLGRGYRQGFKAKPSQADPLPAILDFKKQLATAGIELIVVPVPAREGRCISGTCSRSLPPARGLVGTSIATDKQFMAILEKNGIKVDRPLPRTYRCQGKGHTGLLPAGHALVASGLSGLRLAPSSARSETRACE